MRVIATAGHVDHGKSTLVQALTGIDPDRLAEEKSRGLTIDLGFAWMTLPGGEEVGIIDVPGHIDFIKNMLAGVGGVDAALLVIAADEGVMPQTYEHLAILDLLEIPRGVVALTKVDLVDDPEWLELVQEEIQETLVGTALAGAPVLPVSAHTGQGLEELNHYLATMLAQSAERIDLGRPRLPIDRVFTVAGFGTVVTGTLIDGSFALGDELLIYPQALGSRIRGLQTHKHKIERAQPGSRVAVNLIGVHPDQLGRGQILAKPGTLRGTKRIDARLRALGDAPSALKHNMEITFHCYATEVLGRLRLLEADELAPGDSAWVQIELREPVAVLRGDRFIIRRPSPSNTLGGGMVVDPTPRRRHRRRRPNLFARFETLQKGDPADLLAATISQRGPLSIEEALQGVDLPLDQGREALATLLAEGRVFHLDDGDHASPLIASSTWQMLTQQMQATLQQFHAAQPLRMAMPREELKSRLQPRQGWSTRTFNALIARAVSEGTVREVRTGVALPAFAVTFSPRQQAAVEALLGQFQANPKSPPSYKQCLEMVDEEVMGALLEQGNLLRVAPDVVFLQATYEEMVDAIRHHILDHGQMTVADCRDLFDTSRKYALALLEYLDQERITRREGDARVLR